MLMWAIQRRSRVLYFRSLPFLTGSPSFKRRRSRRGATGAPTAAGASSPPPAPPPQRNCSRCRESLHRTKSATTTAAGGDGDSISGLFVNCLSAVCARRKRVHAPFKEIAAAESNRGLGRPKCIKGYRSDTPFYSLCPWPIQPTHTTPHGLWENMNIVLKLSQQ